MQEDMIVRIYNDLRLSADKVGKLHKKIKEDFKFTQGKQWEDSDIDELKAAGRKALTINKIKPIIKLLTGIERQSKSDYRAFPEGGEDELTSDIVTRLMKNVSKNSRVEIKFSEIFKNGSIGGMSFIEPYIDYNFDLINGDLKFKKIPASNVFLDPNFQEYDLSDSRFLIKITNGLTMDELITLFPDKENKIKNIQGGKLDVAKFSEMTASPESYNYDVPNKDKIDKVYGEETSFDLIDYYYKQLKTKYYVVIKDKGVIKEFDTRDEADNFALQTNGVIISRKVPVIMLAQAVGDTVLFNDISPFYPKWKTYPIIPYFAELITEELDDFSLKIQGIVRGIKDLQEEYNKRRTQELGHLNASANSGFDIEKDQLSPQEKAKLKKFGSSPGILIERKKGTPALARITPMPLSQGHSQLASENAQDLKEASGVNPDLLANDSQSQSGRAILFKQRQGLQMIQESLDNFGETKRQVGLFILSQIPDLFTVESALKVLGDAFIADNFTVPINIVLERGLSKIKEGEEDKLTELERSVLLQYPETSSDQPIVDENNAIKTMVDIDSAIILINKILNDAEISKYDVAIGEGPYQETIKLANFTDLKDLAQQGVPIPPQSLIETSLLESGQKKNILRQLAAQVQAAPIEQAQPKGA